MVTPIPRTRPKNARRPQARSLPLRDAIAAVAAEYDRMSVRQLFYQLVSRGVIPKTEGAYKRVCDASAQMRLDCSLGYRKIADGHRPRRAVWWHGGLREALEETHRLYRRNYRLDQPVTVEVWSEKDALSGVLLPVCDAWGVTDVATRGFPSITLRYASAVALAEAGNPAMVLYLGDHDASGRQISDNVEEELRQHGADVTVERLALDPPQIRSYALPTRPGKQSDSRHAAFAARFGGASVELDALPPDARTEIVNAAIVELVDRDRWHAAQAVERLERATLGSLAVLDLAPGETITLRDGAA